MDDKIVGFACGVFSLIAGLHFGLIDFQGVIYGLILDLFVAEVMYAFVYSK